MASAGRVRFKISLMFLLLLFPKLVQSVTKRTSSLSSIVPEAPPATAYLAQMDSKRGKLAEIAFCT